MIFGVLNPEKIWHQCLVRLFTSPVYCSHFTLGNPKKSFLTVLFIRTSDYLRYLRRKQTVTPLPTTPENVTVLPCKMHNFFIWLKICCIPPNVGVSEKSRLWVGIGGSEENPCCDLWQMECQASNVTTNVQSDHLLHGYMLPVFFATDNCIVHYALLKFSPQDARNSSVWRIGTRYSRKTWKYEKSVQFTR